MDQTPDILKTILRRKREEIAERRALQPESELRARVRDLPPTRGFAAALDRRIAEGGAAVIAEIKRASPSKGLLRSEFDPPAIARAYAEAGAACLSVLTDVDFFQGSDAHLQAARAACPLPVLRKDFTIDPYQVYEARAIGADAILLIAACLSDETLAELNALAQSLGLDVLIEVHDAEELARALRVPGRLIGINNRNLHTFEVSLKTTLDLLPKIPPGRLVVTESGIGGPADIALMRAHGVHAFLIGETLMRAPDPGAELRRLLGGDGAVISPNEPALDN